VIVSSQVTWVRVEKPVFDLAGILISSLGITGICVALAVLLGAAWGAVLVRRGARRRGLESESLTLRVIRP
jgi:hypothetical protein